MCLSAFNAESRWSVFIHGILTSPPTRWLSGCPPEAGPPSAEKRKNKMPCIYILRSNTKQKFYIGSSKKEDAEFRLKEHNAGRVRSTKFGRPWSVVYQEKYTNYSEARKRELFLKSGQGRKWFLERWLSG